jgi:hypothetical protein
MSHNALLTWFGLEKTQLATLTLTILCQHPAPNVGTLQHQLPKPFLIAMSFS